MFMLNMGGFYMPSSPKKNIGVLELITTPMDFNGQTLFPMRVAAQMQNVHADFLTYRVENDRIREQVETMGGKIHIMPHRLKHPIAYIRQTAALIREKKYDVVHCHGNSSTLAIDLLAAKLGGAKVRIAHSHNTQCKFTLLHHMLRLPFNMLYTHAMACGDEAGRWLFGRAPFTVVRNAIDARRFAYAHAVREEARAEFGFGDETVVGCVANFDPAKNHLFLLDAFAKLLSIHADYRLVLVGGGNRDEAESHARALGITEKVIFAGTRTDVPRLLQMMDIMVLPSLFEGFPTVALEWQAAGLPALLADTITRSCAFVDSVRFVPLDADAWAKAILAVKPVDRAAACLAGREALAKAGYDLTAVAADLEASYRRFAK